MVLRRSTNVDRALLTLRNIYNDSTRSLSPDEAAAFKMWTALYKKYERNKENFDIQNTDAALIYFDVNPKAGPKIGITRRDRLARHRLLDIDGPEEIVRMIVDDDWVGDYVYGERPPYYMSRLIDAGIIDPVY
jgi:hypothetical protein